MTKDKMDSISITPGQKVQAEHFRLGDGGLESNVQDEFDYRFESLFTSRVITTPISSDSDWGLSGWTPSDSLEITTAAGDIICDKGAADIGGRRYIRTGSGSIKSEIGDPADATYFIRIKYVVSTDTHSFIAESTQSANTNDNKYITLATAVWTDPNWTAEVDLRSSNTSLQPPVTFSGDTDASVAPVLFVEQTGSTENSLEVVGGDSIFFTSGSPFKHVIYGNDTVAIRLYSGATNYGDLRASSSTPNYLETPGSFGIGTDLTVTGISTLGTVVVNGAVISAATSIGSLGTITLANSGASMTLLNAADQTIALTNSGAGNLNMSIDGKITVSATGSSIAGSATVGGVVLNANDVTADAINLNDATNQMVFDANGTWTGTHTMTALDGNRTWTWPNASGTVAVSGTGAISVNSTTGEISHSTSSPYKHVPTAGATTQMLQWSVAGTAKWVTFSGGATIANGGAITVIGTQHNHTTSEISNLNAGSDFNAGTLPIARGGTNATSFTANALTYYTGTALASIAAQSGSTYCLVGGSPPAWDNSPTFASMSTTSQISAGSYLSATTYLQVGTYADADYIRLSATPVQTSNRVTIGTVSTGQSCRIMDEDGGYLDITPSSSARTYFGTNGTGFGFSGDVYASGITLANTKDILPENANNADNGNSSKYWQNVYSYYLWYKTGGLGTFDHLDDLAIIDTIKPTKKKNSDGVPTADLSGLPKEIVGKDGWSKAGSMQMLIVGGVKQLHKKVKDQDELIAALMDQIDEIKKELENAS